ncbi:MAG: 5'-nucleotidase C-terminal domain-containing protein, partial [Gemmobacter sp.]|nr:5'-nucleotidase C-terminal domain-containing protein [Gemmobacter sp.]
DLCPYPNFLRVVRITGTEAADWLERAAGIFHQLEPGQPDQALTMPDMPTYNFDLIEGLTYEIDPSAPARFDPSGRLINPDARRIRNLKHQGRPVTAQDVFLVATNSYRADGGGRFPGCRADSIVYRSTVHLRSDIETFLRATGTFVPPLDPVWRFSALPGTSAVFDAGPGARVHLPYPGLTVVGPTPDGFLRMRVTL